MSGHAHHSAQHHRRWLDDLFFAYVDAEEKAEGVRWPAPPAPEAIEQRLHAYESYLACQALTWRERQRLREAYEGYLLVKSIFSGPGEAILVSREGDAHVGDGS